MPNQFTSVTTQGYGSRIMNAIVGVPLGLLIIVVAIGVLYWNEGRVDLSKIAQKSTPVSPQQVDASANGRFVSVTGQTVATQPLGDGAYLQPGPYVAVQRTVEEYAWVQDQSSQSQNNVGGSQTTTTTYTYKQEWTDSVADSSTFHDPTGHQNPAKPLDDTTAKAATAKVGAYSIDPQTISLPTLQAVNLSSTNTILTAPATPAAAATSSSSSTVPATVSLSNLSLANSSYLFAGTGSIGTPQIGDIRISYQALPAGTNVTVFGILNGGSIASYTDSQHNSIYNLLLGDRNTAIATLHNQYETLTWVLRIGGIIAIWIGLMMLLAPLNILLDFLPIAGEISSGITLIITLPLALLIGITVILISFTLHHVIALIIGVPVVFALGLGVFKLIKHGRGLPARSAGVPVPAMASVAPMSPAAGGSVGGAGGSLFPATHLGSPAPANPAPAPVPAFPAAATPGLVLPVPPPARPTMSLPPSPTPPPLPPTPAPAAPTPAPIPSPTLPLAPGPAAPLPGHVIQPGQPPAAPPPSQPVAPSPVPPPIAPSPSPSPAPTEPAADPFFPPPGE